MVMMTTISNFNVDQKLCFAVFVLHNTNCLFKVWTRYEDNSENGARRRARCCYWVRAFQFKFLVPFSFSFLILFIQWKRLIYCWMNHVLNCCVVYAQVYSWYYEIIIHFWLFNIPLFRYTRRSYASTLSRRWMTIFNQNNYY